MFFSGDVMTRIYLLKVSNILKSLLLFILFCTACTSTPYSKKVRIRIPSPTDFTTFDPRQARDLLSINILRLMFVGLTHLSSTGSIEYNLAKEIALSPDGLTYTIVLKNAFWSDESPITSEDFIYTWKTVLEKRRACPNAYSLFVIKNAQKIYQEQLPLEEIGLKALDESTFQIMLEQPCPFFLQLLSTPAFLALPRHFDKKVGLYDSNNPFPVSGPFSLHKLIAQTSVELTKNPSFWNSDRITYQNLVFPITDDETAIKMYEANELEWVGSPLGTMPIDSIPYFKQKQTLETCPSAGTYFLRVNVTQPHLKDALLRRTLSHAIDREELCEHALQATQIPASALSPPFLFKATKALLPILPDLNKKLAITLSFSTNLERNVRVAQTIQQQFEKNLGIRVILDPNDSKSLYAKIKNLDYELALGSWFADYLDPHNFYSVFESASNGTNNTGWESTKFQEKLAQSLQELDTTKRNNLFQELENILAEEMPIIPIFHTNFIFCREQSAREITLSPLGHFDIDYTQSG